MIFEAAAPEFDVIVAKDAVYEVVADGYSLTEGLVWRQSDQSLIFSELVSSTVNRWSRADGLSVLRRPSNITNGNYLDRYQRLISCEHATSSVSRLEECGRLFKVLASHYDGKELNSPNDVIVDSQDRIWFTDPPYGRTHTRVGVIRDIVQDARGVYRLDPDGTLTRVVADFVLPNGLCLSPDESVLYINDTDRLHIRRFAVKGDGSLSGGEVFAEISGDGEGKPDGMKADTEGRIYCTGPGGIHVLLPDGTYTGRILARENTRNFCCGGPRFDEMFFGTSSAVLHLDMAVTGVAPPVR